MVAMFRILLHSLQVLLVALEAPGVVLELRARSVAPFQAVIEDFSLLESFQLLLAFRTGRKMREAGQIRYQLLG